LLVTKPHLLFKATTLPEKQVGVGVSPSRDEFFKIIPNRFSLTRLAQQSSASEICLALLMSACLNLNTQSESGRNKISNFLRSIDGVT
jgi:hypothetical protein